MKHAVISGAGLVGSLWALYLAKRDMKVTVYERRPDMRESALVGGRSINLALSDRGLRALRGVGLETRIRNIATPMHGRLIHDLEGNTQLQPYGKKGQYINSVSRSELNMILMNAAQAHPKVDFCFEHRCVHVNLKKGSIHFANEKRNTRTVLYPDLIFGADGAFSAVRGAMQITDRFNYQQFYLQHGYKELSIPPTEDGGFRMEPNALHIWPRKSFMLIALPNLDGSFTVTLFLAFEGENSFANLQTPDKLTRFFQTHFSDVLPLMPDLETDFFEHPTGSLVTVKCRPWVHGKNIALIGDAAHAIVPFYGQGMNAGFEDCRILNDILEECTDTHGNPNFEEALAAYNVRRKPDGDAIADLALRNFIEMRDLVSDPAFLFRKKVEKELQKRYPKQYMPLYSMVTFSHIPYAHAIRISRWQDRLFEQLMQGKKLEETQHLWESGQWNEPIARYFEQHLPEIADLLPQI